MAYADILRSDTFTAGDIADKIDGLIPAIQNGTYTYGGVSTGSANVHAISTGQAPSAYANGQIFSFRAGYTNTGATTLNAHSLGAVAVQDNNTRAALVGGEIVAGSHYYVQYYSSVFYLLNPTQGASVSYTATPTGFSVNPTSQVARYFKVGRKCTVMISGGAAGTSNATTYTYPAPFAAATISNMEWKAPLAQGYNNGAYITTMGMAKIVSASSTINLYTTQAEGAWSNVNDKVASFAITYETAS
jgi:hypothetical protein